MINETLIERTGTKKESNDLSNETGKYPKGEDCERSLMGRKDVYGWFFVDALIVMVLTVIYLLLMRRQSHWGEPESVGTTVALQTHNK